MNDQPTRDTSYDEMQEAIRKATAEREAAKQTNRRRYDEHEPRGDRDGSKAQP